MKITVVSPYMAENEVLQALQKRRIPRPSQLRMLFQPYEAFNVRFLLKRLFLNPKRVDVLVGVDCITGKTGIIGGSFSLESVDVDNVSLLEEVIPQERRRSEALFVARRFVSCRFFMPTILECAPVESIRFYCPIWVGRSGDEIVIVDGLTGQQKSHIPEIVRLVSRESR